MSIFLLFMILGVSKVSADNQYENFFRYIGINTNCTANATYNYSKDCAMRCDNLNSKTSECVQKQYYGCACNDGYIPMSASHSPLICCKKEDCPQNDPQSNVPVSTSPPPLNAVTTTAPNLIKDGNSESSAISDDQIHKQEE